MKRRRVRIPGIGPETTRIHDNKIKCAAARLRDMLRLNNNQALFRNLTRQLYHVTEKHLPLEDSPRQQVDGWVALEAELVSTLPDIFNCEDARTRLELAMQIMAAYHCRRRFHSKQQIRPVEHAPRKSSLVMSVSVPTRAALRKKRKEAKKGKENDVIDLTDDESNEKLKVGFVEPILPQIMDISNLPIEISSPSTSPPIFVSSNIAGPSTLQFPASPLHAESSSQGHSSNNANIQQGNHEDAFLLTGITRVASFLNDSFPPMTHFLKHFVEFGCTSEEYLAAISTWPVGKISHFLSQVSAHGSDERKFSQMEMIILQNHFISYFNKAQT